MMIILQLIFQVIFNSMVSLSLVALAVLHAWFTGNVVHNPYN